MTQEVRACSISAGSFCGDFLRQAEGPQSLRREKDNPVERWDEPQFLAAC
jgi:hypothetical protein